MAVVADTFCIDVYEASRSDATAASPGTDGSVADSRPGVMPWMVRSNAEAATACEAAGKRLCTPAEWELACRGPDETVYGYGNDYAPQTCNGIDTFGMGGFRLEPTGAFTDCTNAWGVFDMNGNVWEHVLGGDDRAVRGGAFNCSDSRTFHRCDYVPRTWTPSALGFRCCKGADHANPEPMPDGVTPEDAANESGCLDPDMGPLDVPPTDEVGCLDPDPGPEDVPQDAHLDDSISDDADSQGDAMPDADGDGPHADPCPADMAPVQWGSGQTTCMDRYEASRSDATSTAQGSSPLATSRPGVMPWNPVTIAGARAACEGAGKRLCRNEEWFDACRGSGRTVYSYGNDYEADTCNGIDAFCYCEASACSGVSVCPYPHCRVSASPAGDGGPCGAAFQLKPTGSFPDCINEWGVFDINGNVWELVDHGDGIDHFRGGAYNCGDSEALHRCDHDATWGPSARGFRCCKDPE
jgi:formylglycine-generating enzyme required for sulfatase activity